MEALNCKDLPNVLSCLQTSSYPIRKVKTCRYLFSQFARKANLALARDNKGDGGFEAMAFRVFSTTFRDYSA